MSRDPYSVLGVDRNATDEEIKKVYHELVKKNHPDRFQDPELARVASEKMKEINAAYEEIQKIRAGGGSSSSYGPGSSYGSYGGSSYDWSSYDWGQSSSGSSYTGEHREIYARVRQFINNGSYYEAEALLNNIEAEDRNAEWHFLYGAVCMGTGRMMDAGRYFDQACNMDPANAEYRNVRQQFRARTSGSTRSNWNNDPCADDCLGCCRLALCLHCCC